MFSSSSSSSLFSIFTSVRGKEGITEKTLLGGFLSMASIFICTLLFCYEVYRYFSINIESHVTIDSLPLTNKVVPIHYSISFPYVSCNSLTLNAETIQAEDYSHFHSFDEIDADIVEVYKEPIDTRKVINAYNKAYPHRAIKSLSDSNPSSSNSLVSSSKSLQYSLDIFHEHSQESISNWVQNNNNAKEKSDEEEQKKQSRKKQENFMQGCRISGTLRTTKVNGEFRFTIENSLSMEEILKDLNHLDANGLPHLFNRLNGMDGLQLKEGSDGSSTEENRSKSDEPNNNIQWIQPQKTSHIIHYLYFGDYDLAAEGELGQIKAKRRSNRRKKVQDVDTKQREISLKRQTMKEKYETNLNHLHLHLTHSNPLSGLATFPTVDGHYGYNLRIVPTLYSSLNQRNKTDIYDSSYEYSFVESLNKGIQINQQMATLTLTNPAIHFAYEYYPILLNYEEKKMTFFELITSICAILGGLFTVFSIIDSFLYTSARLVKKND